MPSIFLAQLKLKRAPFITSFTHVSVFTRLITISVPEIRFETEVAIATPLTPISSTMTVKRFKITFITPATVRKIIGFLVSPEARKTELPKLYIMANGVPKKYISR